MNDSLRQAFEAAFGTRPTHLSRAPGRVNLIGEHTDYNDLPVLPMALHREVRIVALPRDDGLIRLENVRGEFAAVEFRLGDDIPRGPLGHWGNYVRAPAQELSRHSSISRGFDGVVHSSVPVASGLSSSSALVNAVGLALMRINRVDLDPLAAADLMAEAERYTGTRGGGMDQAISMAAREGCASRIDFSPLRASHVEVPDDWRFVVADSGIRAEKSGSARASYNLRRAQCEEAIEWVGKVLADRGLIPRDVLGYAPLVALLGHDALLSAGAGILREEGLKRFRHVVSEARRVDEACEALRRRDIAGFGALMDASHTSLAKDFEVSIRELDQLVEIARRGGAVGARLTGAGFGGCVVALSPKDGAQTVLEEIHAGYHRPHGLAGKPEDHAFVARAAAGASWERI